ncbi:MAG: type II CAAX endopeptidase family protein [Rhodothermales bacterium]
MESRAWILDELDAKPDPVVRDGAPTFAVSKLTGWLERQDFHPVLAGFLLFVVTFVLFQGLATVIAVAMVASTTGFARPEDLLSALQDATGPLLVGNTIGQFFGMAIPVLLWTKLHTRQTANYLRFKAPDPGLVILSIIGLVALFPVIQWLGQVNQSLPLPKVLVDLERSQMELIERILSGGVSLPATVFALAITPAICEEMLFRGYLQRQFERSLGAAGGIVVTGILFGLYHFRLSQAIPLAMLGVYLGFLVWRTGSIWVVVIIHFLNNGFAIAANSYVAANPDLGIKDIDAMAVPWPLVVGGALILAGVVTLMNKRVEAMADPQNERGALS